MNNVDDDKGKERAPHAPREDDAAASLGAGLAESAVQCFDAGPVSSCSFSRRRRTITGLPSRDGFRLSLVVPMYNEEEVLPAFFERVVPIVAHATPDYEIICVNDGSADGTCAALQGFHAGDSNIKIVDLTRNFGKEMALTAGLDFATGDVVIPFDVDLQDPPELIPDLIAKWREGFEVVLAIRRDRSHDTFFKRASANLFYRIVGLVGEVPIPANAGDFRLMDRRVVDAVRQLPERTRFMKGMFAWIGFRQAQISYDRPPRVAGTTKWKPWKLFNFALDGIASFTTAPLRVWTYLGLSVAMVAAVYMTYIVLRTLVQGVELPGYASIVVMLLFFNGLNMIGLGILGEYLGRVFTEVKQRPLYLVRETVGLEVAAPIAPAEAAFGPVQMRVPEMAP